ncbi:MAG TPA: phosphopeptide-binding protein [Bacteroidetes bacterium]|nr:phosphopeptide-binding protein [Bacteroidota bacterium]
MKKLSLFTLAFLSMWGLQSCTETTTKADNHSTENTEKVDQAEKPAAAAVTHWEKGGLKVYAMEDSPKFADASLELETPAAGLGLVAGANQFKFNVSNYELAAQTSDAEGKGLANSGKGQHIHFILNNGPYSAHYSNEFEKELDDGHYVLLAFLSRSYHESVKAPAAAAIRQFVVGEPANFKEMNLSAPHMFYSRPKGAYYGADTKKLMLDFYLANVNLAPDGHKVRATINGNEFVFTKWAPYLIEGLPMGTVKIKLELLGPDGNLVKSRFNPVEREVVLAEMKPES